MKKSAHAVVKRYGDTSQQSDASRKLVNRRKLIAAARKLFCAYGYHAVTTRDIASEAGVVQGTFYSHFKDKTECYLSLLNDVDDEICDLLEWFSPPMDAPPEEILRSWARTCLGYNQAHPNLIRMCQTDIGVMTRNYKRRRKMHPLHRKWIALIDGWKKTGQASPDFDTYFFTHLINDVIRTGNMIVDRQPERLDEIAEQITRFLIRSIKADA